MQNIILFEDSKYWQFSPLIYIRPVYDLRCGINLLKDKIIRQYYDVTSVLFCRNELKEVIHFETGMPVNDYSISSGLLINGRVLDSKLSKKIVLEGEDKIYKSKNDIVAIRFSSNQQLQSLVNKEGLISIENSNIPVEEINVDMVEFTWELVFNNGNEIRNDFNWYFSNSSPQFLGDIYEGTSFLNEEAIHIGNNSTIKPGVVIDAEEGPVLIGNNVKVMPNVVITGPVFIGDGSTIKAGTKIYENTSIGEVCKVGGEVECSILQSYSNKQHDGFLGHSYLGSWVNLGADTNNSDLKNNYSNVSVEIHKQNFDTGKNLFGLIMGDHSKSAINTQFNTGTFIGVFSNVFGHGFPPRVIPSFAWGGFDNSKIYDAEKAIETAAIVKSRRNKNLSSAEEKLIKSLISLRDKEI